MAKGYKVCFGGDEHVLKCIVVVAAQLCKYTKNHWIIHFKKTATKRRNELLIYRIIWVNLQWKNKIPRSCILYDSIYITSLKWQKDTNGEQISDWQELRRRQGWEEGGYAVKGQHDWSLWWWNFSVPWLYQYQYPGCNIVLEFCKMLPLG